MSVVFTGTMQGTFTADGNPVFLQIRQDLDWIRIYNLTNSYAAGANKGAEYYWQRGMTQGRGSVYLKTTATNALQVGQIAAQSGFYLVDSSVNVPGAAVAYSAISNAVPPVVSTGNTAGLNNGSVVRMFDTVGSRQIAGIDFTIGAISTNSSFTLAYMAQVPTTSAGTFRLIPFDPIYYPRRRVISKISNAANAIVTMTVDHGFTVGQVVRFVVPEVTSTAFGMTEIDGLTGTILAIGQADADSVTNTITVDIDTTGFGTFVWPLTTDPGFTPAQVVPVGENTAEALNLNANILADATVNQGFIGIQLMAGNTSPGGANNDVIYWVAGKSFSNDAEPVINP